MSPPDSPMSREALLGIFCQEMRQRLDHVLSQLAQGESLCDYEAVHQEFDSLQGAARSVDLPWLEEYSRTLAGYARFLGRIRHGSLAPRGHELMREMARELARRCQGGKSGPLDMASLDQTSGLLRAMRGLMRQLGAGDAPPCPVLPQDTAAVLLVVDDSATSRLLFRLHLPPIEGCEVMEAENAEQAMTLARARRPDVVFLDYNMPGLNGVEIALRMRAANLASCFILLTANVQQSVLDEARTANFANVLEKPVTRSKIAAILQLPEQD